MTAGSGRPMTGAPSARAPSKNAAVPRARFMRRTLRSGRNAGHGGAAPFRDRTIPEGGGRATDRFNASLTGLKPVQPGGEEAVEPGHHWVGIGPLGGQGAELPLRRDEFAQAVDLSR